MHLPLRRAGGALRAALLQARAGQGPTHLLCRPQRALDQLSHDNRVPALCDRSGAPEVDSGEPAGVQAAARLLQVPRPLPRHRPHRVLPRPRPQARPARRLVQERRPTRGRAQRHLHHELQWRARTRASHRHGRADGAQGLRVTPRFYGHQGLRPLPNRRLCARCHCEAAVRTTLATASAPPLCLAPGHHLGSAPPLGLSA